MCLTFIIYYSWNSSFLLDWIGLIDQIRLDQIKLHQIRLERKSSKVLYKNTVKIKDETSAVF